MYYENYGDYMRNQNNYQNMNNPYMNMPTYQPTFNYTNPNQLASNLYPKLYQEIIQKINNNCTNNDFRLTDENITRLANSIYEDYKSKFTECKDSKQIDFIKDLIKIIIIKYLLTKQRTTTPYQQPAMPGQMPFGYMGYQY